VRIKYCKYNFGKYRNLYGAKLVNLIKTTSVTTGIQAAINRIGSQAELAKKLNIKQQAVSLWVRQGYAPERHVDKIKGLTGIPASSLMRPETVRRALDGVSVA
jgi:hypothetical protein